ncbi:unnamed protein product [Alternaria burnsii]|nr:unnamed protein product [Alternaria burnsii]
MKGLGQRSVDQVYHGCGVVLAPHDCKLNSAIATHLRRALLCCRLMTLLSLSCIERARTSHDTIVNMM